MRWPWVSRATHEAAVEALESLIRIREGIASDERAARRSVEAAYTLLVEKYAARGDPPPKATPKEPDVVTLAIIEKSKGSRGLRRHFGDYVALQRQAGVSEEAIAAAIRKGESESDEPAEEYV